eukprot:scaffold1507_cov158-Ochromonas_danica.AAC.29
MEMRSIRRIWDRLRQTGAEILGDTHTTRTPDRGGNLSRDTERRKEVQSTSSPRLATTLHNTNYLVTVIDPRLPSSNYHLHLGKC